jgi:hypothetical protein
VATRSLSKLGSSDFLIPSLDSRCLYTISAWLSSVVTGLVDDLHAPVKMAEFRPNGQVLDGALIQAIRLGRPADLRDRLDGD